MTVVSGKRRGRGEDSIYWDSAKDAPVNNLMVGSRLACSFQGSGIADSCWGPMGWPRFHGFPWSRRVYSGGFRGSLQRCPDC